MRKFVGSLICKIRGKHSWVDIDILRTHEEWEYCRFCEILRHGHEHPHD